MNSERVSLSPRRVGLEPPAGVCQTEHEHVNSAPKSEQKKDTPGEIGAGHVLGRYELLLPIASGGMAMVWAARLTGTRGFQKIVAVKTMLPKLCEDDQFEQMFLAEASLSSQIRHPHVVEIMDLGEHDGVLYLVMEWIDGVALNQLMKAAKKQGGIPLPIAVRVMMQTCAGLHSAHELKDNKGQLVGLVHRDVSPQNILVTYDGVTKVVDFGIAKATAMGDGATVAGQIKGKVAYMAPEQVKGGSIDRRVDIFAAGIVLYALTTGKHPLRRESEAATMYNICSPEPVMAPSKIIAGYPPPLERVVMQALAKDPGKRYPTANEFLRALDQALPASMRASTDEDVAAFVASLFGDRRRERADALQQALELADKQRESRIDLAAMAEQAGTLTPVSSVSLTGTDTAVGMSDSSLGSGTGATMAGGMVDPGAARRRLAMGAMAAGLVVVGGLAAFAAFRGGNTQTIIMPSPSAAPAAQNNEAEKTDEEKQPDAADSAEKEAKDPAETVDLNSLEVEKPEDEEEKKKSAARWSGRWKGSTKAAGAPKPPAAPAADKPKPAPATDKPAATPKPAGTSWDKTSAGF
jgi:serine/threonine protein kinase